MTFRESEVHRINQIAVGITSRTAIKRFRFPLAHDRSDFDLFSASRPLEEAPLGELAFANPKPHAETGTFDCRTLRRLSFPNTHRPGFDSKRQHFLTRGLEFGCKLLQPLQ
jgi:hypothetical protein